ncbi:cation-transporting P-type ATPase [Olivibacter sp. SDN3]|uniref:cation-transporting P-type ATPase n=1 Tax=Olivibacter sp. SDN3 TaxID=2764720 RepID=UPI0016514D9A|nr:cation-transporting P-type ATPase [Olivibacter sp. SDN3]QNL49391.1 cation-transporting P-type ATPase [Olivibacter sp. SDN3]
MTNNNTHPVHQWFALDIEEVIADIDTNSVQGLSEPEASSRLEKFGPNKLPERKQEHPIIRFLKHFHDVLIYVLFAAAIITAVLGHYIDTIVIVIVAIVNACIGYFQENKAEKALENIKKMLSLKAKVIRDNERTEILATDLTLGDIVLLSPGDKVPADLRLIRADNLKIEESPLTGESVPSEKITTTLNAETVLGDQKNMAFTSTTVSSGTGIGIVVAIGKDTEIGKINEMMTSVEELTTPLLRQTAKFGQTVSFFTVFVALATFLFGYFLRNYDTDELLMSVIGLAVAAIPEGLPAILSIILAIGVQNMAKRQAIIRNLPSVETLGSVSVICSDKTGTLTKNEMTVQSLAIYDTDFTVSGIGYSPEGKILSDLTEVDATTTPDLERLVHCFYICNEATLGKDERDNWTVKGDPTEGALITLYHKANTHTPKYERLSTVPFDSEYKYMATLIAVEGMNKKFIYIKGAPDRLLDMSDREQRSEATQPFNRNYWQDKISEFAHEGQRVIGAAYKIVDPDTTQIDHEDVQKNVVFLGLAGIIDPPREEAIDAIKICKEAGITVKMITGDHVETAKAIGKTMGIGDGAHALEGKDLEQMDDEALKKAALQYNIFARTSPEHKLRLVNALQASNLICAMTGDGVNDAPALKKANVGIAMGIKGTEVTKDASEMVLADDNFSTIVSAVKEGRRVYDNLKKTILFVLPTNGAESFLIMASIIFGTMMPLIPVQILWVNMVTSVTVSLALAFENIEKGTMKRSPRPVNTPLLSNYFIWRILLVSVLIGGGTLWLSVILLNKGFSEDLVRTITLQTIVITQLFHLFNCRSIRGFAINRWFFTNKALYIVGILLFIFQFFITYSPFMNRIFGTVPLAVSDWVYPYILGIAVFIIIEIEKTIMRKLSAPSSGN